MMRMRKFLAGYACFFLSVFLLLVCLPLQALAAEGKVVRVGWYDGGYNITGSDGERSGYGYDFQQTVAAYTGWRYEYVKGSSVARLICLTAFPTRRSVRSICCFRLCLWAEKSIIFTPI